MKGAGFQIPRPRFDAEPMLDRQPRRVERDPRLAYEAASSDAVVSIASIKYLVDPRAVIAGPPRLADDPHAERFALSCPVYLAWAERARRV